jgi:hypothetical protein
MSRLLRRACPVTALVLLMSASVAFAQATASIVTMEAHGTSLHKEAEKKSASQLETLRG